MKKNKIDKNTNLAELIELNPEMNDVLYEYGLYCGDCYIAGYDTLEAGAMAHGLEEEEITELIQELNKKVVKKK